MRGVRKLDFEFALTMAAYDLIKVLRLTERLCLVCNPSSEKLDNGMVSNLFIMPLLSHSKIRR